MPATGLPIRHPIRRERPASRDVPKNQHQLPRTDPDRVDETDRGTPPADRDADTLAAVRAFALAHLAEPHTVADLAAHAGMSPRSFARHFQATTGTTPLRWLITQRIAAAQKLLERTDLPLPEVARRTGFGSEITMRQHFATHLSTSPRDYRLASHQDPGPPEVDTAWPDP